MRVPLPTKLSKADARRALIRHHFTPAADQMEVFRRLRSIQFDPIAPVGCNHDLVLQARLKGYKVGYWMKTAYQEKLIYDGWDKMASLVPMEGWPVRRFFHDLFRPRFEKKIFEDYKDAVEMILAELRERGPMLPKQFDFQQRREDWKVSWHGPNVTKNALRALWHTGQVVTVGRKGTQHLYDLTERFVPARILNQPPIPEKEAKIALALERHRAMGMVKPVSAPEIWSYTALYYDRKELLAALLDRGDIVPVEVEGIKANATPAFLSLLDQPALEPRVVFVGPLDPIMWDRKMVRELFGFDYVWEIYTPEAKRRWGYYVLPVLFGDQFVARAEFFARAGVLELREWHWENGDPGPAFWTALEPAVEELMSYARTSEVTVREHIDKKAKEFFVKNSRGT